MPSKTTADPTTRIPTPTTPTTSPRDTDLADLVHRLARKDDAAWADVVRRFAPVVRKRIAAVGLSSAQADDAFQQTWLKLAQSIHTIEDPARLGGWLGVTARNEAVNLIRRSQRLVFTDELELGEADESAVDRRLQAEAVAEAIDTALGSLSARQQDVVRLRYLGDDLASYTQIAGTLDMPKGAIGPTLGRALTQLRRHPSVVAVADRVTGVAHAA